MKASREHRYDGVYEGVEFCLIGLGVALEEERQIPR